MPLILIIIVMAITLLVLALHIQNNNKRKRREEKARRLRKLLRERSDRLQLASYLDSFDVLDAITCAEMADFELDRIENRLRVTLV